ncbi:YccF domain-containing protein [Parapedobacter deserti]|uniref:YccF domain-containing protein n=1 Tax=Parapedobacter deserti TaxID=1912957 RepID=A0ABV7JMA1_9SPHI
MNLIGNLVWILFGGFLICLEYIIGGFVLCLTIVGIPFGIQLFKLAIASLIPFGTVVTNRPSSTGCLFTLMNIVWIVFGGIWVALTHFFFGVILCITIIGIPFGRQHFKLMALAFTPFGKSVN